jgi:predicted DNA-binding protein (UPF0251 family)
VDNDWLLVDFDRVERCGRAVRDTMADALLVLEPIRQERVTRLPLVRIAARLSSEGGQARRRVASAWEEYEKAVALLRSHVIRALVDEERVTLSQLASNMGVSRQTVKRLYDASSPADRPRDKAERP